MVFVVFLYRISFNACNLKKTCITPEIFHPWRLQLSRRDQRRFRPCFSCPDPNVSQSWRDWSLAQADTLESYANITNKSVSSNLNPASVAQNYQYNGPRSP